MKVIFVILISCTLGYSQNPQAIWRSVDDHIKSDNSVSIARLLSSDVRYSLEKESSRLDRLSRKHVRYQVYFKNIPILGSEIICHFDHEDHLYLISGHFPSQLNIKPHSIPSANSLLLSKQLITTLENDEVVERSNLSNTNAVDFVNENGSLVLSIPLSRHFGDTATAVTRFSGNQKIITSLAEEDFLLSEVRNGVKISTYNAENRDINHLTANFSNAPDLDSLRLFSNDNNFWDLRNEQMDEIATDIHWGTEMSFDYFLKFHNWLGLDNVGNDIVNIIHIDEDWDEAFYLPPPFNFLGYGDGGPIGPNATLDVVAHEFTHGVVHYSSGLIYIGESSSLDEGLADIFSAAVKFYMDLPFLENPWILAEQLGEYRDLSNPKSKNQPDTYKGNFWYSGTNRAVFAHQNNGIINFWFYLLTAGGSGENDNQFNYDIEGIGIDKSTQITFDAMAFYLTGLSDFFDFKNATIQVAEESYGENSAEVATVKACWQAVGVTETITAVNVEPVVNRIQVTTFSTYASVSMEGGYRTLPEFSLSNIEGKEFKITPQYINQNEFHISTQNLSPGLYLLRVFGSNNSVTKKLIVKKL